MHSITQTRLCRLETKPKEGSLTPIIILATMKPFQRLRWLFSALVVSSLKKTSADCITAENVCEGSGPSMRPLPGCSTFAQCDTATSSVIAIQTCMSGSIFDEVLGNCNWSNVAFCQIESCPPTETPTITPSARPTREWSTLLDTALQE